MNKQQLAAKIWESANKLRSKIEANEYKDYILGFIFYKFLSETEVARLKARDFSDEDLLALVETDEDIVDYVKGECGYFIAYENLFDTWIAQGADFEISNVRDALSAFERNIDPARKKVFENIFDTLQTGLSKLGTDARSQSKAARELIYLIKDIPMDARQGYDVLGYVYEFLLDKFASNAGKKAGEFYTPHEVSLLMSEIVSWHLADRERITIYDPTSGSGSLLINIGLAVARHNGDSDSIKYYAQELKENTYNLTRMNLVMRGILPDNIVTRNGDTLEDDWPWFDTIDNKEETYDPLFVDAVVSNPPYSQQWNPEDKEIDTRFSYGIAPKSKADYAFLLHDLYHLRPDGIMCIVLPHGVLFRGGEEGAIRKNLIENRHIQAIIGLPANIFFGTGIPTIIMVLRKQRSDGDVLFIDASKYFTKEGNSNKLRESDIKRITDAVKNGADIDKFCRLVSIEEIRANDYNLNIPRYVDSSETAETWDVYASMFGGVPLNELDALNEYWEVWPSLKEELYQTGVPCYQPKSVDVAEVIKANQDVKAFVSEFYDAIEAFPDELKNCLIDNMGQISAVSEEVRLAAVLDQMLENTSLIDSYEAYQKFSDAWSSIGIDLEVIQTEGFDAIRKVDLNMVVKKKKGQDVEVPDGWVGHILPFDLVQHNLQAEDLARIQAMESRLSSISQELSEILESFDEDEKGGSIFTEEGDAFVAAELKKAVKEIGKHPRSEYEQSLIKAQKLLDEEKAVKKSIKESNIALDKATRELIADLDDDQCRQLLVEKWITPLQESLRKLPGEIIGGFIAKITALNNKYSSTYADVCDEIAQVERELSEMLDDLTGNEFDLAGINELKKLLGGE